MTRAVHGRFIKDENGAISDHLRNHVHLTNCIHLKNHMHRHSPVMAERSLIRDLIILQRSRSLRDPSTSPPSWHSPSILDALSKNHERDSAVRGGRRRSVGQERRKEAARQLSGISPPVPSIATSKVAAAEALRGDVGPSECSSMGKARDTRESKGGEFGGECRRSEHSCGMDSSLRDNQTKVNDAISRKVESKGKKILEKGKHDQNTFPKTLSEQLKEFPMERDDAQSSHVSHRARRTREEKTSEGPEASSRGHRNEATRFRKRKFRSARRARAARSSVDYGVHNELSVASNSLAQGSGHHKYYMEGQEEDNAEMNMARDPRNGCGIPWNWSRIHHRGKTFLDMAGRSFSCGLSDSRARRGASISQCRDGLPEASDLSSSSVKSDVEATPLLDEPSESLESTDRPAWLHEYSGELGIYANHRLRHDADSELASETQSSDHHKNRKYQHGRHQSLTQKYMPRTFRELVGQNLVVQALSNAVLKRKVGFLYVFYGPHGTGKTSCARIFARALNCQSSEHPRPCGGCTSCIAYDLGKNRNVREVGPVGNFDFENIMDIIENMTVSQHQSRYRVFIFDDCDTLPPDSWSAISKVIDRAPRRVVFILISTNLDHLPHIIMSRCQKFFFPKLKDADIIYTLQWIATKEDLEIEKDALKLIASRSDGSLRDAEMTLEQLSLLGQKISVPLVQELVGMISDEKLVDLLDLALSADTVNTVKNLREIMESGGEPLALMSQLATIITDILAGSYVFTKEKLRRKFFRRPILTKEDMEKLRQALKTLSEAEKQLRLSNDKLTWLTAALLQLAPDQQYMLPSSSTETSFNHSPAALNSFSGREVSRMGNLEQAQTSNVKRASSTSIRMGLHTGIVDGASHEGMGWEEIEQIWVAVLEKIQISGLKQFMHQEAKPGSINFGAATTVQLMFSSNVTKAKAEKFRGHILQAFESILGSPVTIEMTSGSRNSSKGGNRAANTLHTYDSGSSYINPIQDAGTNDRVMKAGYCDLKRASKDKIIKQVSSTHDTLVHLDSVQTGKGEISEVPVTPRETDVVDHKDSFKKLKGKCSENVHIEEAPHQKKALYSLPEKRNTGEQSLSQSLVKSKVSLAHVIQQADTQRTGWSRRKAMSIAEKLEQENLRLEPRSRALLCWKSSRITRGKLSRFRIRTRKPRSLLKLVPCGKCLCSKSPR
ncbi:hypothetical protein Sjap_026186 [Stephania japonica]|uniref:AAA+ ATPase domain-containing protein n=1 Tax=Stephania japonica TaxID=461633 RepID=A0AAP0E5M7_9MAGN